MSKQYFKVLQDGKSWHGAIDVPASRVLTFRILVDASVTNASRPAASAALVQAASQVDA